MSTNSQPNNEQIEEINVIVTVDGELYDGALRYQPSLSSKFQSKVSDVTGNISNKVSDVTGNISNKVSSLFTPNEDAIDQPSFSSKVRSKVSDVTGSISKKTKLLLTGKDDADVQPQIDNTNPLDAKKIDLNETIARANAHINFLKETKFVSGDGKKIFATKTTRFFNKYVNEIPEELRGTKEYNELVRLNNEIQKLSRAKKIITGGKTRRKRNRAHLRNRTQKY